MLVDKITEYTVYESPDGGKTVYARKSGETDRYLHSIDPDTAKQLAKIADDLMWTEIRQMAEHNEALQKAINNVILIYNLTKDNAKQTR
jgi:hypothetical protein